MRRWDFIRWAGDGSEIYDSDSDELIAKVLDGPDELTATRLIAMAPRMADALRMAADALEGDIYTDAEECESGVANARAVAVELRAILEALS